MLHPEAPYYVRAILGIHIVAGTVALFVVPVVMAVRKGGAAHRRYGMVFVYGMAIVALTALIVAPYFGDYFLLFVAIFSAYLTFAGWRALAHKRPEATPAAGVDWGAASLAVFAGCGMLLIGIVRHAYFRDFTIVLGVLGLICAGAGGRSMLRFIRPPRARSAWLFEHFGMMLAAYIATVTAFSAVNFHFLHPIWLRWLWPTVAGTIVITAYMIKYKRAIARGKTARQLVIVREPANLAV